MTLSFQFGALGTVFLRWLHRNPDRKLYAVRLVRGEHENYFYPNFVARLEDYPGESPMRRL